MNEFYGLLDDELDNWVDITPQSAPVFKVPLIIPETQQEQIDDDPKKNRLTSPNFDQQKYVHSQFASLSYQEFVQSTQQLEQELQIKELGLKSLVRSCFDDFVMAKGQVDVVYSKYNGGDTLDLISSARKSMDHVLQQGSETFQPLLERKKKSDQIKFTLQTLSRYASLFKLPLLVQESCAQIMDHRSVQLDHLIRDVKKGKALLMANIKRSAFKRVWNDLSKALTQLVDALLQKLQSFDQEALLDDKERCLFYIGDLDKLIEVTGRGTESILIKSLYNHITLLLQQCLAKYKDGLEQVSDVYLLAQTQEPQSLKDVKFGNALMLTSNTDQYKSVFSKDPSQQAWQLVNFLTSDTSQIMTGIFSELARLARNSIDGKYAEQTVSQVKQKRDQYVGHMQDLIKLQQDIVTEAFSQFTTGSHPTMFNEYMRQNVISTCVNAPSIVQQFEEAYLIARKSVASVYTTASAKGVVDISKAWDDQVLTKLKSVVVEAVCTQWPKDVAVMYKYHNESLKFYTAYHEMVFALLAPICSDFVPQIVAVHQKASLLMLDGYHFLAVHPMAAQDYTHSSQSLSQILKDLNGIKEVNLIKLSDQFVQLFKYNLEATKFIQASDYLYELIFKMHVSKLSKPLVDMLDQGVLYAGNLWASEVEQLKVNGYVNEVLLKLVLLLSNQCKDVDTQTRLRTALVQLILDQLRANFQKVDCWSPEGCLKAVLDVSALSQALSAFIDCDQVTVQSSRKLEQYVQQQYQHIAKKEVPYHDVDKSLRLWKKSCEVLLKCFHL